MSPQEGDIKKRKRERKRPRKARRWLCEGKVPCVLNQEFLFWFTSIWVLRDPSRLKYRLLRDLSLWGSHVRRKFWKRTTLRSKSSTLKGLLYAGWRSRCKCSEECRTNPWSVVWARKLSSDKQQSTFIHELDVLWWFHTWAVVRSLANARKVQLEDFVRKKGMNHVQSNGRSQQMPSARFGKEKTCL